MTIPANQASFNQYQGNGVTQAFDYTFGITDDAELRVVVTDLLNDDTDLELGTDYTVSGVGDDVGGKVTLVAGPLANGHKITIIDNIESSQETPFGNQSAFFASLHEASFDKLTRLMNRVLSLISGNILRIPDTVLGVSAELPKPSALALFRWNGTATGLETILPDEIATTVAFSDFRVDTFIDGDGYTSGVSTSITLSEPSGIKNNTQVYFDGVYKPKNTYTMPNTTTIDFGSAIAGTPVIEVVYGTAVASEDINTSPVSTGTGDQPVNVALDQRTIPVDTVVDLKDLPGAKPRLRVSTKEYDAGTGSGSNDYVIEARDGSADDGGSVIHLNDGVHQARLIRVRDVWVSDYGADTTGTTTSHLAVQKAILDNPGARIRFSGKIKMNERVVINSDDTVIDLGDCEIDATEFSGWALTPQGREPDNGQTRSVFEFRGNFKAETTVAEAIPQNSETIAVADASNIAVGDCFYLTSDTETWYTEGPNNVPKTETNKVLAKSGNVLTLAYRTKFSYSITGFTVTVLPYTPIRRSKLIGGKSYGGGYRGAYGNGIGPTLVSYEGYEGAYCYPHYVEGFQNRVANFFYGIGAVFDGESIRGHTDAYSDPIVEGDNSGFYGAWFNSGREGYFRVRQAYRLRHVTDGARYDDVLVEGGGVSPEGGHRPPYGCHNGCDNWVFSKTEYNGPETACLWRGFSVKLKDNKWKVTNTAKSGFVDSQSADTDPNRNYEFSGNDIVASRNALQIACNRIGVMALNENIRLEGGVLETAYPPVKILRAKIRFMRINGGLFETLNSQCIIADPDALENGNIIEINNPFFSGYSGSGFRINTAATGVLVRSTGLSIDPQPGSFAPVQYGAGSIIHNGSIINADGTVTAPTS